MKTYVYNFIKYKDLFLELIRKDIKLKYRSSVLGILWSMLTGRLLYQFFSESTNFAMESIGANGQLIKKVYVPKYLFPLSRICSSFITTLISLLPLLLVMIVSGMKFHWVMLLSVVPLFCLLITSIGVGLILSTINVFFKDMKHLYSIVLTVIMYMTPIFYPASIIPSQYRFLVEMNPLFNIVGMFRVLIMEGALPSLDTVLVTLLYSCIIFLIGFFVFYKKQDEFIFYI